MNRYIKEINDAKLREKEKELKQKPLESPSYLENIGYVRCNCRQGIPSNNRNYESIPTPWKIGNTTVRTFERIMYEKGRCKSLHIRQFDCLIRPSLDRE